MIKVIGNIPKNKFGVAFSGGIDSVAVVDFLLKGNHVPELIYFNHNTDHGMLAENFVKEFSKKNKLVLHVGRTDVNPKSNKEKVWSDLRYDYFSKFDFPIITCHHLDDCVETYIFSMLRGFQSTIPYSRGNVIRPFLLNEKSTFDNWCNRKKVDFIQDESNFLNDYSRNRIRNNIVPEAMIVNPGLKTVVRKLIETTLK